LFDQRLQNARFGAFHDSAESSDSGITTVPVLVADVLLDESHDGLDDITLHTLGVKLHSLVSSAGNIVLIIASILVLSAHRLQQDRNNLAGSDASKSEERTSLDTLLLSL
jgi:hypothetical protein